MIKKFKNRLIQIALNVKCHSQFMHLSDPVLVYQMGKVASSSIYDSLKLREVSVFHVHRLNVENILAVKRAHIEKGVSPPSSDVLGRYLNKKITSTKKPAKIISMVREPVGRNISAFFQNLNYINNIEQLISDFMQYYDHDVPLNWFDIEMESQTGINVYDYKFPQRGYQVICKQPYQLLVMRHDLDDSKKESVIGEFVEIPNFKLIRSNEASSKNYAQHYKEFLSTIKLPQDYVMRMLTSKDAMHFYPEEERQKLIIKWTE